MGTMGGGMRRPTRRGIPRYCEVGGEEVDLVGYA